MEKYLPIRSVAETEAVCEYLVKHPEIMVDLAGYVQAEKSSENGKKTLQVEFYNPPDILKSF